LKNAAKNAPAAAASGPAKPVATAVKVEEKEEVVKPFGADDDEY